MKSTVSNTVPLNELRLWQADQRLLPSYLCTSDNSRRIDYYKRALRMAMSSRLTQMQREQVRLFYEENITKTEIGKKYGVGSSTICKTLKSAENAIREYVELYMHIYDEILRDLTGEEDEYCEQRGE